jgi:hypothetical protein
MATDSISLQARRQIFAVLLAQTGKSISRSIDYDVHTDLIHLMWYSSLLPLVFISDNVRRKCWLSCQLSRLFIHSHIILVTTERPSRASPGGPSLFPLVRRLAPHNAIIVRAPAEEITLPIVPKRLVVMGPPFSILDGPGEAMTTFHIRNLTFELPSLPSRTNTSLLFSSMKQRCQQEHVRHRMGDISEN